MQKLLTYIFLCGITLASYGQTECTEQAVRKELALTHKRITKGVIQLELGKCFLLNGVYDSSSVYLDSALQIAVASNNTALHAEVLFFKGELFYLLEKGQEAIDSYNEALKIPNGLKDDKKLATYNSMGVIYMVFDEYENAINYFERAISYTPQAHLLTKKTYEFLYNNKGITYAKMGQFDSAMVNHKKCLAIRLQKEDNNNGVGQSYNNLGTVFYDLAKFDSALIYFEKGLAYRQQVDPPSLSSLQESQINIGKALIAQKKYAKAEQLLLPIDRYFKNHPNSSLQVRLNEALMNLYQRKGAFEPAYKYSIRYYELKDSMYGIAQREELIRMNLASQYEEKKMQDSLMAVEKLKIQEIQDERERELNEQRVRESNIILWSLVVALILMLGIAVLIYRNYRSKKKASDEILIQKQEAEKQRDIAQKEKQIATAQTTLVSQQKKVLENINQEITDSINYAKRIQNAILPAVNQLNRALDDYFLLYLPKAIVAGDFYWMYEEEDLLFFAVADCTGHGVPGALVSVVCSNALNSAVGEFELRNPAKILDKATVIIEAAFEKSNEAVKDGMDVSICCFNKSTKIVTWSGANNPIYIIQQKITPTLSVKIDSENTTHKLLEIKGDKQAVGWYENRKPFKSHSLQLVKGDQIYLFTDGYADQFGGVKGKKLKYKPFKSILLNNANKTTAQQLLELENHFKAWKGELEQVDDVCVLGYRVS